MGHSIFFFYKTVKNFVKFKPYLLFCRKSFFGICIWPFLLSLFMYIWYLLRMLESKNKNFDLWSVFTNHFCITVWTFHLLGLSWKTFVLTNVSVPKSMQKWHSLCVLKREKVKCFITWFKSTTHVMYIWYLILHKGYLA